MPPKTEIKDRTLHDLHRAVDKAVKEANTPEEIDVHWQTLHGPARDALSLTHWRMLIEQEQQARKDVDGVQAGARS